jgi:hypothetical protein
MLSAFLVIELMLVVYIDSITRGGHFAVASFMTSAVKNQIQDHFKLLLFNFMHILCYFFGADSHKNAPL